MPPLVPLLLLLVVLLVLLLLVVLLLAVVVPTANDASLTLSSLDSGDATGKSYSTTSRASSRGKWRAIWETAGRRPATMSNAA